MTPKEKAINLVGNIGKTIGIELKNGGFRYNIEKAKECALIAVDELIVQENSYNNGSFYPSKYWQEVKQEIDKL